MIPFNKPFLTGVELEYVKDAVGRGKLSGNGEYTRRCQEFMENRYGFLKCLLTSSCTDALEMAAILCNVGPGDEVIMPSYTFVSTANAFVLRGAKVVFVDSRPDHPGLDEDKIEELITPRTKVIVPVHYAGVACDMDKIMGIANQYGLFVVEDAAQAIDSFYFDRSGVKRPLGGIGHFAAFSFHETKNISCGEGGMLVINDERFTSRAEIVWEKGTNRSAFWRGEVDKYGWVDIGSSFLASDITAAFLWAQLERVELIQSKRIEIWSIYKDSLSELSDKSLPNLPRYATNNAHMFYLLLQSEDHRSCLLQALREKGIMAVFHYVPLHSSKYYLMHNAARNLKYCDHYSASLLRLPLYPDLTTFEAAEIAQIVIDSVS